MLSPGSCLILTAKPWGDTSPCSKSNLTWTRKNSGNRARDLDEPLKSDLFVILHCKVWIGGHKSVISRPPTRSLFICYSKFSIKLLAAILTFSICFFHSIQTDLSSSIEHDFYFAEACIHYLSRSSNQVPHLYRCHQV